MGEERRSAAQRERLLVPGLALIEPAHKTERVGLEPAVAGFGRGQPPGFESLEGAKPAIGGNRVSPCIRGVKRTQRDVVRRGEPAGWQPVYALPAI